MALGIVEAGREAIRSVIQEVERRGGTEAAIRLAGELNHCSTPADFTRLLADGQALLKRLGEALPVGLRYFGAAVPAELKGMFDKVRSALDLGLLQEERGRLVSAMQNFLTTEGA